MVNTCRASIFYTAKYAGKTGCAFLNASSKEAARKYIEKLLEADLKSIGAPEDCFKLEIKLSSKDEIDFYLAHRDTRIYNGLSN